MSNTETAVKELEMIDNVRAPHCGERVCDPETKGGSCTPHPSQPSSSDISTLSVLMANPCGSQGCLHDTLHMNNLFFSFK